MSLATDAAKRKLPFSFFVSLFVLAFVLLQTGYFATEFMRSTFSLILCLFSPIMFLKAFVPVSIIAGVALFFSLSGLYLIGGGRKAVLAYLGDQNEMRQILSRQIRWKYSLFSEINLAYLVLGVLANSPNLIFGGTGGLALSIVLTVLALAGLLYSEFGKELVVIIAKKGISYSFSGEQYGSYQSCGPDFWASIWKDHDYVLIQGNFVSPTHPLGHGLFKATLTLALFGILSIGDAVRFVVSTLFWPGAVLPAEGGTFTKEATPDERPKPSGDADPSAAG